MVDGLIFPHGKRDEQGAIWKALMRRDVELRPVAVQLDGGRVCVAAGEIVLAVVDHVGHEVLCLFFI